MNEDPIVAEVRKAGAALAAQAGNDVHQFFQRLRLCERESQGQLVMKPLSNTKRDLPQHGLTG